MADGALALDDGVEVLAHGRLADGHGRVPRDVDGSGHDRLEMRPDVGSMAGRSSAAGPSTVPAEVWASAASGPAAPGVADVSPEESSAGGVVCESASVTSVSTPFSLPYPHLVTPVRVLARRRSPRRVAQCDRAAG